MKKIVVETQPMHFTTSMYVIDNENELAYNIPIRTGDISSIIDTIALYIHENNDVDEVNLIGPAQYAQKVIDELKDNELLYYTINKIAFKIL